MEANFERVISEYTIDEAIETAQNSYLPWAHKLAQEVHILQLRIKQYENSSSSRENFYEDLQ